MPCSCLDCFHIKLKYIYLDLEHENAHAAAVDDSPKHYHHTQPAAEDHHFHSEDNNVENVADAAVGPNCRGVDPYYFPHCGEGLRFHGFRQGDRDCAVFEKFLAHWAVGFRVVGLPSY